MDTIRRPQFLGEPWEVVEEPKRIWSNSDWFGFGHVSLVGYPILFCSQDFRLLTSFAILVLIFHAAVDTICPFSVSLLSGYDDSRVNSQ